MKVSELHIIKNRAPESLLSISSRKNACTIIVESDHRWMQEQISGSPPWAGWKRQGVLLHKRCFICGEEEETAEHVQSPRGLESIVCNVFFVYKWEWRARMDVKQQVLFILLLQIHNIGWFLDLPPSPAGHEKGYITIAHTGASALFPITIGSIVWTVAHPSSQVALLCSSNIREVLFPLLASSCNWEDQN